MENNIIDFNGNVADLHAIINSNSKVVVDFWASWCGPCKLISPIINKVASLNTETLFVKVNIDTNIDIAEAYSIRSVPYIIVYVDGVLKTNHIGAISETSLASLLV